MAQKSKKKVHKKPLDEHEVEQKYQAILENLPVGVFETDKKFKIKYANSFFCRMLGFKVPTEVIGIDLLKFFPTNKKSEIKKNVKSSKKQYPPIQIFVITKDSKRIDIELRFRSIYKSGRFFGLRGSMINITEFNENNRILKKMGEVGKIGAWELDVETFKTKWTSQVYHIHEVDSDYKTNAKNGIKFYTPEAQPIISKAIEDCIKLKKPFDLVLGFITAKKNKRWVHSVGQPVIEQGKVAKVFGTFQDVTEKIENQRKLLESETKFAGAFKTSAIGMALVSLEGKWLQVNKALTDILSYSEKELLSKTFQDITHPDDLEKDLSQVKDILKGDIESYNMEKRYFDKDGKVVWVLLSVSLVRDKNKEPLYFVSQIQDINKKKLAELKNKSLEELKNKFVKVVSHQLRTPLTSIKWNLESLRDGTLGELKPEQKEFITSTLKTEIHVTDRLTSLLTALDIEEGRADELTKEHASLESIWGSVIAEFDEQFKQKNIKWVQAKSTKNMPSVEIDREKIIVVLKELVKNALLYTKDGGSIRTKISPSSRAVKFEIKDSGIGIPEFEQDKIFERFFRASNSFSMTPNKTGIGLYISKYYVEQHKGQIGFKSKEGKGTTFWFTLPLL